MLKIRSLRRAASGMQYAVMLGLIAVFAVVAINQTGQAVSSVLSRLFGAVDGSVFGDTRPDTLSFLAVTGVNATTVTSSAIVQVNGIESAVPVTISGSASGKMRICPDATCSTAPAFGAGALTVSAGQYLQLQVTSAANFSETVTVNVSVGSGSASWTVTTRPPNTTPNAFAFTDNAVSPLSNLQSSNIVQISGLDIAANISVSGNASAKYRVCTDGTCSTSPAFTASAATIANNQFVQLQLTSASSANTQVSATLTIGGGSSTWTVTTSYSFTSQTFTPCGATGQAGPSLSQCQAAYSSPEAANWKNDSARYTVVSGIQRWTVPDTATYRITAQGGQGSCNQGGLPATMRGDFALTQGTVLYLLVGQRGLCWDQSPNSINERGGGGGGSFVVSGGTTALLIAGGGGGPGGSGTTGNATTSQNADNPVSAQSCGAGRGGLSGGGGGGGANSGGGGGGGLLSNGGNLGNYDGTRRSGGSAGSGSSPGGDAVSTIGVCSGTGGKAFVNGGGGGFNNSCTCSNCIGGFGGGGGSSGNVVGGGGGGYSGGAGGHAAPGSGCVSVQENQSTGGGSYNIGTNPSNTISGSGDGYITILHL